MSFGIKLKRWVNITRRTERRRRVWRIILAKVDLCSMIRRKTLWKVKNNKLGTGIQINVSLAI